MSNAPRDERDADRLRLLDRLAERVPDLDLDQHSVEWIEMPDGPQGLAVDGGGFGGDGNGFTFGTRVRTCTRSARRRRSSPATSAAS